MKYQIYTFLFIFYNILFNLPILGHGFDLSTPIETTSGFMHLEGLLEEISCSGDSVDFPMVLGYDFEKSDYSEQKIASIALFRTNCYVSLKFDNDSFHDINCSPAQEFYLPHSKEWVSASNLKANDMLLTKHNNLKQVKSIELVKEPLELSTIEVKEIHNFFAGYHCVLTHNIPLPALYLGFSVAFGSGAVAGASAGSFFGPITIFGGAIIGGLIGIGILLCKEPKIHKCNLIFDTHSIEESMNQFPYTFKNKEKGKSQPKPNGDSGAQAPGKPTEADGYTPPKKWDGEKVRNPNGAGYGWPDKNGEVWVPTGPGPMAHGGPHWDVQNPQTGGHRNILPGGKIR